MKLLTKDEKKAIERLCLIGIESLGKKDGMKDANSLKNFLDTIFTNMTEREYAYKYSYEWIKEKLNAYNNDKR